MKRRDSTRRRRAMVMKAILIALLVIGAVVMPETDANAHRHTDNYLTMEFTPKELEKVVAEAKQHADSRIWLFGFTDRVGSSKEFGRVERKMEDVRQTLIQYGLSPDIFHCWLILEGYAPRDPKRRGIKVIVAWPSGEKDKR
jgi:hypothetical protein